MIPASAASTAPRSELSSQGCTTMVVAAGEPPGFLDQPLVLGLGGLASRAGRRCVLTVSHLGLIVNPRRDLVARGNR